MSFREQAEEKIRVPAWTGGDDSNDTLSVVWTEKGEDDLRSHVTSGRCSFYSKNEYEEIKMAIEEV